MTEYFNRIISSLLSNQDTVISADIPSASPTKKKRKKKNA